MGLLDKLLKTEQKIRKRIESAFGDGTARTPLEIRREIVEQVAAKVMPDRGGRVFPFVGITVRLHPKDKPAQDIFRTAFVEGRSLEADIREALNDSGASLPPRFQVQVAVEPPGPEQADPVPAAFTIGYIAAADVAGLPRPAARLCVVKGTAEHQEYEIAKDRVLIGRMAELVDREGQMARRNDVVFLDDGDEINSTVGRAHATVFFHPEKHEFRIADEVSRFGTRVFREGRSIEVPGGNPRGIRLQEGDEIFLGRAALRFTQKPGSGSRESEEK
jgi:hypothetical protein